MVEAEIVALEDDDAGGGRNGDVVGDGVFDGVVEGRGVDGFGLGEEGLAQSLGQLQEGGRVEGECCSTAGVGGRWVGHGGQLGAREMVSVHWDEGGDWG